MSEIKKAMRLMDALAIFPSLSNVLIENGITKVKVFQTLEEIIKNNGKDVEEIIGKINKALEDSKKPVNIQAEDFLDVSQEAVKAFKDLIQRKGLKGHSIKVIVHSPSPNTYAYALDFEKKPGKDDLVLEKHGLKFFFSKNSVSMLKVRIEYDQKEQGFRFEKLISNN